MKMKSSLIVLAAFSLYAACDGKRTADESINAPVSWSDSLVINKGDQIVAETFDTLRRSLLSAIQAKGASGAIAFCSENAVALTSVYSDSVNVRRTALRARNPLNAPDSLERHVLQNWEGVVQGGGRPGGKVLRTEGQIHYFKPIMMQAFCMSCHGAPQVDIHPATLAAIKRRYPKDIAINFVEGDLRGSWHLIFKEKK